MCCVKSNQFFRRFVEERASKLPYRNEAGSPRLYLNTVNLGTVGQGSQGSWPTCLTVNEFAALLLHSPLIISSSTTTHQRVLSGINACDMEPGFPSLQLPVFLAAYPKAIYHSNQYTRPKHCCKIFATLAYTISSFEMIQAQLQDKKRRQAFLKPFKHRRIQSFH